MAGYGLLSDCGRSIRRPLAWLVLANAGFAWLYRMLATAPEPSPDLLFTFTTGHLLPFVGAARDTYRTATIALFGDGILLAGLQALTMGQGLFNAVQIFLLLQAVWNHFRVNS